MSERRQPSSVVVNRNTYQGGADGTGGYNMYVQRKNRLYGPIHFLQVSWQVLTYLAHISKKNVRVGVFHRPDGTHHASTIQEARTTRTR